MAGRRQRLPAQGRHRRGTRARSPRGSRRRRAAGPVGDPAADRRLRPPAAGGAARPPPPPFPATLDALTQRETEVLLLIARGMSNTEISGSLVIAMQTTKTYVGRILAKLGLRDRAQAVVLAYESGLVTPREPGPP